MQGVSNKHCLLSFFSFCWFCHEVAQIVYFQQVPHTTNKEAWPSLQQSGNKPVSNGAPPQLSTSPDKTKTDLQNRPIGTQKQHTKTNSDPDTLHRFVTRSPFKLRSPTHLVFLQSIIGWDARPSSEWKTGSAESKGSQQRKRLPSRFVTFELHR